MASATTALNAEWHRCIAQATKKRICNTRWSPFWWNRCVAAHDLFRGERKTQNRRINVIGIGMRSTNFTFDSLLLHFRSWPIAHYRPRKSIWCASEWVSRVWRNAETPNHLLSEYFNELNDHLCNSQFPFSNHHAGPAVWCRVNLLMAK